jgi:hypothetical protein
MEIDSDDYHDFVIKEGRLIGEFEQMYRKSRSVPWHQDEQENWLDIRITIEFLREYGPFDFILDFGAGYGYFLDKIAKHCGAENPILYGYDISKTACIRGRSQFPHIIFREFNLMAEPSEKHSMIIEKRNNNLFMMRGTLWYIFPKINNSFHIISTFMEKNELFLVSQNFPPLSSKFVGKDVIPNPEAILDLSSKFFRPLKTIWLEDSSSEGNDNWFIAIMKRI